LTASDVHVSRETSCEWRSFTDSSAAQWLPLGGAAATHQTRSSPAVMNGATHPGFPWRFGRAPAVTSCRAQEGHPISTITQLAPAAKCKWSSPRMSKDKKRDPVSRETGSLGHYSRGSLTGGSRREDVHDAVQIFNTRKFNAHASLSCTQGDLDVRVKPVGQR
jgi:hypothetical protein